ncbi:hypothetical protein FACS189423_06620 [Bacteroidia bacterium]|nr:hypothetical protein FACS189423_06620 [Bacteroidia bacterium]
MDKPGVYSGKDVKITVTNDCGTTTGDFGDAVLTVVANAGKPGPDVEVEGTTYKTWTLLSNVTWMVDFSKSGSPDYSAAPYDPSDMRYGYYKLANAASGCPSPFRLPTADEATGLLALFNSTPEIFESSVGVKPKTGNYGITGLPSNAGSTYWHIADDQRVWLLQDGGNTIATTNPAAGFLVKCVKD